MKIIQSILFAISVVFHKLFYNTCQEIIIFTGYVKSVIENPLLDIFVLSTENKVDDKILKAFRAAFNILYGAGEELSEDAINKHLQTLNETQNHHWNDATIQKLAALMYKELQGEETTQVEADTITQLAYAKFKNKG